MVAGMAMEVDDVIAHSLYTHVHIHVCLFAVIIYVYQNTKRLEN